MDPITVRSPLAWNPEDSTPLADESIVQFTLPTGVIEVRHKGTYLEVHMCTAQGFKRLLIQPWVSNQVFLSIEP